MEAPITSPQSPRLTYASPGDPLLKRAVINTVELATGRRRLERMYREVHLQALPSQQVWKALLDKLEVKLRYDEGQLSSLPKEGPLVFVANHPFGVLDGLVLGHLVAQAREEFYVLVNEVLTREPTLAGHLLPIDFRETKAAARTNLNTRSRAMERLQAGAALAIFPAGGVATAPKLFKKTAEDLAWKRFVAKLITFTEATVVPIYFHGQNSRLFQVASQVSANLRLSLLLHEIRNKIGAEIKIEIGDPIPYADWGGLKKQALIDSLRERTLSLGGIEFAHP